MAGVNDNLIPPVKGEVRNPKGKPKGTKHLSTIIQELANNIDWDKTTLKNKDELKQKYGKNGFKAVAYVALTKAMTGDTRAMEWLAKHGYGTNIDITSGGDKLNIALVEYIGDDNSANDKQDTHTDNTDV